MVIEEVQLAHPQAQFEVSTEGDNEGLWDGDRLARVVQNLAANAVVHGEPGTKVAVRVYEQEQDSMLVVHNSGAPVPEKLRTSLFHPFRRDRQARGGLGLGLYITRELIKAHGGEISFASSVQHGTTFTVRLPRTVAAATESQPRPLA
jgi:signal transduction histidine kinase